MSADLIKKVIIAVAVVCLLVWILFLVRTLAAAPVF
jgi:hypothetical protein